MDELIKLTRLLPNYEDIKNNCSNEGEADYILKKSICNIKSIQDNAEEISSSSTLEVSYLLQALVDKCWERIHTGHFSEVPLAIRKIYAIASYFRIFYILFESLVPAQVEQCSEVLDDAILIGCTQDLYEQNDSLQEKLIHFFESILGEQTEEKLPIIEGLERQNYPCDIPELDCPSVEIFRTEFFDCLKPALLLNTIKHWPALQKWRDLNYILRVAGNRRVPIEIGSNYATEEWSQQLVKIRDFLRRQFSKSNKDSEADIEYLAQHELFDQIAALKEDIRIPDYCSLGSQTAAVDIKAWLGPKGTISPLHFDPKHNLLCQVFGSKRIILASPTETSNLYAHQTQFLGNTSQIDAENLNEELYPLVKNVKFYHLTLQEGDCIYIPPKWWHYVRSLSKSFSVSFWWE